MKDNSCCSNANPAIECTVKKCKHHCDSKDFCSLNKIQIGTHEVNPTEKKCTDCNSFEAK